MSLIFPKAQDYKTITVRVSPQAVEEMEERLGERLDLTEKIEFNFYRITRREGGGVKTLGTIMALAGKGEYGAIEVVTGVDGNGRIVGVYIQQMRERKGKELRSPEFLSQFRGKTINSPLKMGQDIKPVAGAEKASELITKVVKKMLVFYEVLGGEKTSNAR